MYHLRIGLVLAVSLATVTGCGGKADSLNEFSPTPQAPEFKAISGTIQGLNGALTLGWADRTESLTDGSFSVPLAFESGGEDGADLRVAQLVALVGGGESGEVMGAVEHRG